MSGKNMKVMIWGGRSKARIAIEMISEIYDYHAEITGIFDTTLKKATFESEIALYHDGPGLTYLCKNSTHFVICIGGEHGYARVKTAEALINKGLLPIQLISKHGFLDNLIYCGEGLQVMPGAIVHKFFLYWRPMHLNTNSTVDHECTLGNGVHIMGAASIAGRVEIGDFSTVGTNATILPNLKIGKMSSLVQGP